MGEMQVPADAYYGASTQRAATNFPISGQPMPRRLIRALGMVKRAAAQTNRELGLLPRRRARAIAAAAQEVVNGKLFEQFPIDVYQTGSGTSTNTNANEVIANRATEILGGERGSKLVHPNDHVNLGQSSNDVVPTAIQLAAAIAINDELLPALERLQRALEGKSKEFWPVIKTGRTHLQDATPIRLGQEFKGYAGQIEESVRRGRAAIDELSRVPLGGTAVGTGINTHPQFARLAAARLAKATRLQVKEAPNHFHAQASLDVLVAAHGALRTIGTSLWKIGSDIRLMGSGPIAGLGELRLPETQPGSSIMPGKVNPVIVESMLMAIARVYGNDTTVVVSGQAGSIFELNVMMPVAAAATLSPCRHPARDRHHRRRHRLHGDRRLVAAGLVLHGDHYHQHGRLHRGPRPGHDGTAVHVRPDRRRRRDHALRLRRFRGDSGGQCLRQVSERPAVAA